MIGWTRVRLAEWGRWCRGGENHGLPTMAAFARANTGGRAAYDAACMPEHIELMNGIVMGLAEEHRVTLVTVYCRAGPLWWKAAKLNISIGQLRGRIKRAESAADISLDCLAQ